MNQFIQQYHILSDNNRAERRGNLENITLGIVSVLYHKPVASFLIDSGTYLAQ